MQKKSKIKPLIYCPDMFILGLETFAIIVQINEADMKFNFLVMFSLLIFQITAGEKTNFELPELFGDNMVLQRETEAAVWGRGTPGKTVEIKANWGDEAKTTVKNDGNWITKIKTPGAGGPYELTITSGDFSRTFKNVMIGEVWLCSGQSNMEMPMSGWMPNNPVMNSEEEIKNADYPEIRLYTVPRKFSVTPEFHDNGHWSECSPTTVSSFSATAYFFGKKLFKELGVPVGLIFSSWGGTPVEAWTSTDYMEKLPEFANLSKKLSESESFFKTLTEWQNRHKSIDMSRREGPDRWVGLDFEDASCPSVNYDDSRWYKMEIPQLWENVLGQFDGAVWFRKTVGIPDSWLNKNLKLSLGPIDDLDITYVNGERVGGYEREGNYNTERHYDISAKINSTKKILIAVKAIDFGGGGGLFGKKSQVFINNPETKDTIWLAGEWNYLPVADFSGSVFHIFGDNPAVFASRPKTDFGVDQYTASTLYNGMISPSVPFTFKGVIWYQGEANTNNPIEYRTRFPEMIKCWRDKFENGDFPFYYVQIAPYDYGPEVKSQLLREAQLMALKTSNTGMIVTMDIGNNQDIHPANKTDVGERLALWALAKNYGKDVVFSGPVYKSSEAKDGKIILSFDYTDGGLVIKNNTEGNSFVIAGADKIFKKAYIKVEGDKLVVSSPEVAEPVAVRYAWSNRVYHVTLFNKAGLPSPSFRTDDWK